MQLLQTISVTVIAAAVVIAAIFLIPVVLKIGRMSRELEKLIDTVRIQVTPLSRDVSAISREVKGILESIRQQVDKAEEGVTTLRDITLRLQEFEIEVQRRIEEPLLEMAAVLSAVTKGVEAFFRVLRR